MCELVVNLKNIKRNVEQKKAALKNGCRFCAVVKANAYGLGAEKVAAAIESDVDYFAVARVEELRKLRESGIFRPVIVLGSLSALEMEKCLCLNGEMQINSLSELENVSSVAKKLGKLALVHLAFDTGMGRFGFCVDEAQKISLFVKSLECVCVKGVMSHFFETSSRVNTEKQRKEFEKVIPFFSGCIFHIASSGAAEIEGCQYDMVRVGIDLYVGKHPVVSFAANVLQVKTIEAGISCGYDGCFVAEKRTKIATISVGYADGVPRHAKGANVLICGEMCQIVAVCMDSLIVALPDWLDVSNGAQAFIVGGSQKNCLTIFDFARSCDTIVYEILTGISSRVKRKYVYR